MKSRNLKKPSTPNSKNTIQNNKTAILKNGLKHLPL